MILKEIMSYDNLKTKTYVILQAKDQYNIQVKFYDLDSNFETIFETQQHFTSATTDSAQEAVEIISNTPDKNTGAR